MELIQQNATEILILLFLIVTFLQSGIDKVTDWNGNVNFIKDHFKNSPLKNLVPILLVIILVMELIAGAFMFIGVFNLITTDDTALSLLGVQIAALSLIFLLIGQRLAKDYAGAMTLAVYFLITIAGMYLLNS
ncbi:DoxX family membrane protein [Tenacibaculum sp. AHE15PA]|uniref:DoxX family membrane protein n=1 Tax=unclassified Tenacibaculum TaxID=2635139 RepID=UPI001C4FA02E|nr:MULTISPECIES: DoxX family membrane protein [unclassified Tenacibaculum]QXP73125.1 DoxX family membrane protein [Tenacibaculum sp. AHE14PA]QXP77038.1 DoxX family membrane protein [Tenacibaculum sp. AHE15PA]